MGNCSLSSPGRGWVGLEWVGLGWIKLRIFLHTFTGVFFFRNNEMLERSKFRKMILIYMLFPWAYPTLPLTPSALFEYAFPQPMIIPHLPVLLLPVRPNRIRGRGFSPDALPHANVGPAVGGKVFVWRRGRLV